MSAINPGALARVGRTVCGLSAEQVCHRLLRPLQRLSDRRFPGGSAGQGSLRPAAVPALAAVARAMRRTEVVPAWDRTLEEGFEFGGHFRPWREISFRHPSGPPLWAFRLHYFEDAVAAAVAGGAAATALEERAAEWMSECPRWVEPAWHPYPTSTRAINWLLAAGVFLDDPSGGGIGLRLLESLPDHLKRISARLELHLSGNHVIRNAAALWLGGATLDHPRASHWLRIGDALLRRSLRRQILPDGGHYERSPMYQADVLLDVLLCRDVARRMNLDSPADEGTAARMAAFAAACLHPDKRSCQFNDAAEGSAPPLVSVLALAAETGIPVEGRQGWSSFPDSGFHFWRSGERYLAIDAGPPGPREQPGHAHCDALSFELSDGTSRICVNGGTSGYEGDPLRSFQRSTLAHNTVSVDGKEQSEAWGVFRMGGMAEVLGGISAAMRFEGSCRFFGGERPVHHRSVTPKPDCLEIRDRVSGEWRSARTVLRFGPEFEAVMTAEGVHLRGATEVRIELFGPVGWSLGRGAEADVRGFHAPAFGVVLPVWTLVGDVAVTADDFGFRIYWS